jgi:RNA polymerase sigma factor (sigma-70 family)
MNAAPVTDLPRPAAVARVPDPQVLPFDLPDVPVALPPPINATPAGAASSRPAAVARPAARTEPWRPPADLPDGSLLQRFAAHQEQAAFATLVRRYERLVLGVCQRVLGDWHAAQDAFQATFLVLARKAPVIDRKIPLGGWLYKVAYHLALRLRAVAARRRRREQGAANGRPTQATGEGPADLERRELVQALAEELQRLPEKYRVPLVLCYVDGLTHAEAARRIGLPRGSMAKRIGESLERLRDRLLQRGLVL